MPQDAKEAREAEKLLREVRRRQQEIDRLSQMAMREVFAKRIEDEYLKKGLDVYVSLEGPNKSTLRLKYVLFSRLLVYQLSTNAEFFSALRKVGFKKLILTDDYDKTWTWDL